jgi:hypothetical protein
MRIVHVQKVLFHSKKYAYGDTPFKSDRNLMFPAAQKYVVRFLYKNVWQNYV